MNAIPIITRRASFAPSTFDADARTVEATISTFSDVRRRDANTTYIERLDPNGLDTTGLVGSPLLNSHKQGDARDVVGTIQSVRRESRALVAVIRLTDAVDAAPVIHRIREGVLTGISIGYRVSKWTDAQENGTRVRIAAAWKIHEVSVVPVPADSGSRFRSSPMENENVENIETVMPEADQARIRSIGELADLPPSFAEGQISAGASVEEARTAARTAMVERSRATPRIRVASPSAEDPAVRLRSLEEALHARVTGAAPSDQARPYIGLTLRDFAREVLVMRGQSVAGMDADALFRAAMHTTSDFPNLLTGVGRRTLLASYTAAASPLKQLARQGSRTDFREGSALRLGEVGALQKVSESGEIKHVSRSEAKESYALDTYAALFTISRKALVNDDLGAFNDWAAAAGQAAAQTEANLLWALLSQSAGSGPVMSDGTRLFHADHGNAPAAAAVDADGALSAARLALRNMKGLDNKTVINAAPKYLLVGPAKETAAEKVLATIAPATTATVNPFAGKLTLLVEPRLTGNAWYIFSDPAQVPVLEYAYLAGAPGPQISSREGWETLSAENRVYLDFGAGALDWRGAIRNAGA